MNRLSASQRTATASVLLAMAVTVLDAGMLNVALPGLSAHFHSLPSETILVVSAYQAAVLVGLLPAAHIAGRLGHRRAFVAGIGCFAAGAVLCALAPSLLLLVAARIAQGLGAAAVMALGIALLREVLGSERLGAAIAWNALTVAICSAAGPTVGAAILSVAQWPWLFVAGLPLGVAAMLASRALPNSPASAGTTDLRSLTLFAGAVILIVLAAQLLVIQPSAAIGMAGVAALLMTLLVQTSRRQAAPMFPADLLGKRPFALQAGASICCFVGQSIGLVALPFQLHASLSGNLLAIGLIVTCWPVGVACTSVIAGRISRQLDRGTQCAAGGTILAAGLMLLAATSRPSVTIAAVGASLCGIGFGLFQLANNRALFLTAPSDRAAAAGGVQGSARLAGQTAGTMVMAVTFASVSLELAPRMGLAIGAAFALLACIIAALAEGDRGDGGPTVEQS
jgi:DHA2 family multidrug resistance protein-like MFS transporter